MIVRSCLLGRNAQYRCSSNPPINRSLTSLRHFCRSSILSQDEGFPNHYETLDLRPEASATEIKKQFYKLSKSHHPDLHPNDPDASQRFVRISEAYAVLSSAEKKGRYDRDFQRVYQPHSTFAGGAASHPSGSFSSASMPAGGRPASGLSRRRTHFRGPPPSFYASGGWGTQADKRRAAAQEGSHAHENTGAAGTGPGGFAQGFDNDVSHFDQRGHYQTHSEIERTRHRARRKQKINSTEAEPTEGRVGSGGGAIFNFIMVTGVLLLVVSSGYIMGGMASAGDPRRPSRRKSESQG